MSENKNNNNKKKKEDRAFLYFRENAKGGLNIKFGPEKFTEDTEKFSQVLMIGNLKCMLFLSSLTLKEPLDTRVAQYENIKIAYHAILDEAFPDVFDEKKRIMGLEEIAIERAEAGDKISPEFEEKIEEAKKAIKKRVEEQQAKTIHGDYNKMLEDMEDQIELFNLIAEKVMKDFNPEKDDKGIDYKLILINLISEKSNKIQQEYTKLKESESE